MPTNPPTTQAVEQLREKIINILDEDTTVAVIAKNSPNSSIFMQFHNFEAHRKKQS
jgi:hypothetical protein